MAELLLEPFLAALGWVYLGVRYRNVARRNQVRQTEYDGSYSTAGRSVLFSAILIFIGIAITGLILATVAGVLN